MKELDANQFLDSQYREAPTINEAAGAIIDLMEAENRRSLRTIIVTAALSIFGVSLLAGLALLFLYGFDMLPRFSEKIMYWVGGMLVADVVGVAVFVTKAAATSIFEKQPQAEEEQQADPDTSEEQ
jgi:hypothetical protein